MRVSVVIPVYNGERYLAAALDSALAQTEVDFELIVVDDGSTDGTRDLLRRYEPGVLVIEQGNSGTSVARNRGVAASRGELIAFLDADDLWDSDKLATMVAFMDEHPRCLAAYHAVRLIDDDGLVTEASDAEGNRWVSGDVLLGLILGRTANSFSPSQTVVRRRVFEAAGGFPPGVRQAEDLSLWLKIAVTGPILYLARLLGSYRRHAGSTSIEARNESRRAAGRLTALLGIISEVRCRADSQLQKIYDFEVHDAALTLGWFCRQSEDWEGATAAYLQAAKLAPLAWSPRVLQLYSRARCLLK